MKRILSLILCLVMLISLVPALSFADVEPGMETVCALTDGCSLTEGHEGECQIAPEPGMEPTVGPTVEPIVEPTVEPTSEPEDELTLSFSGCDSVSDEGDAYYTHTPIPDALNSLEVLAQSNGELSYSWEKYDAQSLAYAPIDQTLEPSAAGPALSLTVTEDMLEQERLFRCAVSAVLGEQSLCRYAWFTIGTPEEIIYTDTIELFQQGGFPAPPNANRDNLYDDSAAASAQEAIRQGLSVENYSSSINLSSYNITLSQLKEYVQDVADSEPMIFYLDSTYGYSTRSGTNYIYNYFPKYTMTKAQATAATAEIEAEISNILASVDDSMSVVGKMLAVNDYFAVNYQYDLTYKKYDIYDLFVGKTAVCQGYSLGYLEIMRRLNISCETVVSSAMHHMWNIVYADGSWYHIDATWNDPTSDRLGRARHYYFLVSDSAMRSSREHYSWISNRTASNTKYDNWFWVNLSKPFAYANGVWYYVDDNACAGGGYVNINSCSLTSASGSMSVVKPCNFSWKLAPYSGYSGCGSLDGGIMVNSNDTFYKYLPSSGALIRVALADEADAEVMASYVSGNRIVYGVSSSPSGTLTAKSLVPAYVESVTVGSYTDKLLVGGTMTMTVTLGPEGAASDGISWSVDNGTGSASISSDGILTGLSAGTVTVRATDGSTQISGTKLITILAHSAGVPVTGVEMMWPSLKVFIGNTLQLTSAVTPDNATNYAVSWSVTDGSQYASIDRDGLLRAIAPGTVTVKVSATDGSGYSMTKLFQVLKPVTGLTVSAPSYQMTIGLGPLPTLQMSAAALPSDASDKTVTWSVINGTGAATIDADGLLTASAPGTVTVRATANDGSGVYGERSVTISSRLATAVTVVNPSRVVVGAAVQLRAAPTPSTAVNNIYTWELVDGEEYAELSSAGLLTAYAPGTVRVRATAAQSSVCGERDIQIYCDFTYTETSDAVTVTGYTGSGGAVTVPASINRKPVTVFGSGAAVFPKPAAVTRIALPSNLTAIGDNALKGCSAVTGTLTLPAGLVSIGDSAFYGCSGLTGVLALPSELTSIGDSAFYSCSGFTGALTIPDSVSSLSPSAFYGCSGLNGVLTLPSELTAIGDSAFYGCSRLVKKVQLPSTLRSIGDRAFLGSSVRELRFDGDAPALTAAAAANASLPSAAVLIYNPNKAGWSGDKYLGYTAQPLTITVVAPENLAVGCSKPLSVQSNLEACTLAWSVVSGGQFATVDASTGELCGTDAGTVRVRAADTDGSGIFGEADINVVVWKIELSPKSGPDVTELSAGRSLDLKAAYVPAELTAGAFRWSIRDEDKTYASITAVAGGQRITAKNSTTEKHDIVITASSAQAGPEDGTYTLSILPRAGSVSLQRDDTMENVGSTGAAVQTLTLDMHRTDSQPATLQLSAATLPDDAANAVTWTSSAANVAAVDKNTGLVTFVKPGTATINATAADGSGKYASVVLKVIYIDAATVLTSSSANEAGEPIPKIGLQYGYSTTMQVFGTDKSAAMDSSLFTFSSSQPQIAAVDPVTGVITAGEKAGTATVSAALKGDPLNRRATLSVKVIALQTARVVLAPQEDMPLLPDGSSVEKLGPDGDGRYRLVFDKSRLGTGSAPYTFTLSPSAFGISADGSEEPVSDVLTYTSSDSGIATVAVSGDGTVTVKVKRAASATGECVITGTSKDSAKEPNILSISVRDYSPRIDSAALTLNPKLAAGVSTPLLSSYGNTITAVKIYENGSSTPSTRLSADFADDLLTIKQIEPSAGGFIANATVKARIVATCTRGDFPLSVTVTVKSADPAVTVKQDDKFNLFYSDSESQLTVTAQGCTVKGVELEEHSVFKGDVGTVDRDHVTVSYKAEKPVYNASPNAKLTLLISIDGYTAPVKKTVTLATVTTKPSLCLSMSSSVINLLRGNKSVCFTVLDKNSKAPAELDPACTLGKSSMNTFIQQPDFDPAAAEVTLTLSGAAGGTASLSLQDVNWLQPITFSHRISVLSTLPTAKLAAGTLKLSNEYTAIPAQTKLTLTQANLSIASIDWVSTAAAGSAARAEADKLELSYSAADSSITAEVKPAYRDDNRPKAGTYSYKVTPRLDSDTSLAPVTLRVSVSATKPGMTLASSTLRLNSGYVGGEIATAAVKLSLAGYTVTDVSAAKAVSNKLTGEPIVIGISDDNKYITAKLDGPVPNGSYSYILTPTVQHGDTLQERALAAVTLKVTVHSSTALSAAVSASGKLDAIQRTADTSAITYTVTKLSNINGTVNSASLQGADADKFELSSVETNTKGQPTVRVTLKDDVEYSTALTYRVQLALGVVNTEGAPVATVLTPLLSVKVTQSTLKLSLSPTSAAVYHSHAAPISLKLTLTSPPGADIGSVELSSATTLALRQALGSGSLTFNSDSSTVTLQIADAARLKAGSSYTLVLDVSPAGRASNVKPIQVRSTVRAYK